MIGTRTADHKIIGLPLYLFRSSGRALTELFRVEVKQSALFSFNKQRVELRFDPGKSQHNDLWAHVLAAQEVILSSAIVKLSWRFRCRGLPVLGHLGVSLSRFTGAGCLRGFLNCVCGCLLSSNTHCPLCSTGKQHCFRGHTSHWACS